LAIKEQENTVTLTLTEDEAYTLQILCGIVAGDSEVYSVGSKLRAIIGEDLSLYDYDRVSYHISDERNSVKLQVLPEQDVEIRIN